MGCQGLDVMDSDWGQPLSGKHVRTSVFNGFRQTDAHLGVSADGLTKHKVNHVLTKPHILTQRLECFSTLVNLYESKRGEDLETKIAAVENAFKRGWMSELVPLHWCVGLLDEEPEGKHALVLRSGPGHVLCMWLSLCEDQKFTFHEGARSMPFTLLFDDFQKLRVAKATPTLSQDNSMVWNVAEWMELKDYIADFGMLDITAALLSKVCSALKLAGHSKLSHKNRCELFLKHMGRSDEFIAEILANLPEPKKRTPKAEDRSCGQWQVTFSSKVH